MPPTIPSDNPSLSFQLSKIVYGVNVELQKRDLYYDSSGAGRYAFFAFFVAALVVFIVMTCLVNNRRMRAGRTPVISSYLAPPSYYQSQNSDDNEGTNLPTYTQNANPNQDAGYYDKNGNFILTKSAPLDPNNTDNISPNANSDQTPSQDNRLQQVYVPQQPYTGSVPNAYTASPNIYEAQNLDDMIYRRPDGPPPAQTYSSNSMMTGSSSSAANNNNNTNTNFQDNSLPPYEAPPLPEKSRYKI